MFINTAEATQEFIDAEKLSQMPRNADEYSKVYWDREFSLANAPKHLVRARADVRIDALIISRQIEVRMSDYVAAKDVRALSDIIFIHNGESYYFDGIDFEAETVREYGNEWIEKTTSFNYTLRK